MCCPFNRTVLRVALAALLAAVIVSATAEHAASAGGGNSAKKRIILLTNGNSPFWDAAREGLKQGEKELGLVGAGLEASLEVNDGTPAGQISKLRQFASQPDIIGVAVSALDADNVTVVNLMKQLRKNGVYVITVDADVNPDRFADAREFYIGTDNLAGGRALGIAGKTLLESRNVKSGSYVQFVGRTGSDNARKRMDGFKEAVTKAYEEADRMADDLDRSKAQRNVRNAITNHKDLVALVGIWSYNAPAIVSVVKEKKLRNKVTVVTFDAEPIAIKDMADGNIDAMVVQNPFQMGYLSVKVLKALHEKDEKTVSEMFPDRSKKNGDVYNTGLKVVVPDDKSPLKAEMFESNTEFMDLKTFRDWMKKYNLKGS